MIYTIQNKLIQTTTPSRIQSYGPPIHRSYDPMVLTSYSMDISAGAASGVETECLGIFQQTEPPKP